MKCSLCQAETKAFYQGKHGEYFKCGQCFGISLSPEYFLDRRDEKARYETHNNDVFDVPYQKFVFPIVDAVTTSLSPENTGLDFGCGTGPVIQHLLEKKGFSIDLYDPFFRNNQSVLTKTFDFIACCEVIEHFYQPAKEFERLFNLLKPGGKLFCMTDFYRAETQFKNWYYKNDPTHVFFYDERTISFISDNFGFANYYIDNRLAVFLKSNEKN